MHGARLTAGRQPSADDSSTPWQNRLTAVVKPRAEAWPDDVRGQAGLQHSRRTVEAAVCLQEGANILPTRRRMKFPCKDKTGVSLGATLQKTQRQAVMLFTDTLG